MGLLFVKCYLLKEKPTDDGIPVVVVKGDLEWRHYILARLELSRLTVTTIYH